MKTKLVWTDAKLHKPPHMLRVLTYSPHYHGAKTRLEEGVVILCWSESDFSWHDDDGEAPMFDPTHWRALVQVILPEKDFQRLQIGRAEK